MFQDFYLIKEKCAMVFLKILSSTTFFNTDKIKNHTRWEPALAIFLLFYNNLLHVSFSWSLLFSWKYRFIEEDQKVGKKHALSFTIGSVLEGVLATVELAGGVVSFTHSTGIQSGLWTQHLVTTHRLHMKVIKTKNVSDTQSSKFPQLGLMNIKKCLCQSINGRNMTISESSPPHVPHISHQCTRLLCSQSKTSHLWLCWT